MPKLCSGASILLHTSLPTFALPYLSPLLYLVFKITVQNVILGPVNPTLQSLVFPCHRSCYKTLAAMLSAYMSTWQWLPYLSPLMAVRTSAAVLLRLKYNYDNGCRTFPPHSPHTIPCRTYPTCSDKWRFAILLSLYYQSTMVAIAFSPPSQLRQCAITSPPSQYT